MFNNSKQHRYPIVSLSKRIAHCSSDSSVDSLNIHSLNNIFDVEGNKLSIDTLINETDKQHESTVSVAVLDKQHESTVSVAVLDTLFLFRCYIEMS